MLVRTFEQFIPRQIFHDILERLAVVAMFTESDAVTDTVDLSAQDRHKVRAVGVHIGGEEADKQMNTAGPAFGIKVF